MIFRNFEKSKKKSMYQKKNRSKFFSRRTQKRRQKYHTKQVIKLLGVSRVPDASRNSQGARPLVIYELPHEAEKS